MIDFSIIVATYDRNDNLLDFLKSLEKIDIFKMKNIEVLIVQNHASNDVYKVTLDICRGFGAIALHEKIKGKASALNKGIEQAKGSFLFFTDDDVVIKDANWLDKMKKHFDNKPYLGYVSGKVILNNAFANKWSLLWEKKGGLSKGDCEKYWSRYYLNQTYFKIIPWKFFKVCAGANFMMPKKVLNRLGDLDANIDGHLGVDGMTLEIGYRVAAHNYELLYDPSIEVLHMHPQTSKDIKKKIYYYGKQDTGQTMYIFLRNRDFRYLWWSLFGHSFYTLSKIVKSCFLRYPLPPTILLLGLYGNFVGCVKCLYLEFTRKYDK
ncbi:MAG: glycosyltransferase [Alphaproteobacteria bacterium]|jgi:GT2 family glycosyltransferase|nr:glycosyltransferase [Alphaproteobacteria bacterium]